VAVEPRRIVSADVDLLHLDAFGFDERRAASAVAGDQGDELLGSATTHEVARSSDLVAQCGVGQRSIEGLVELLDDRRRIRLTQL
jgi:hypothetical protein